MKRLRFCTPVHRMTSDAARELIMASGAESQGHRQLVGEFPPGTYVTSYDTTGFKVYRVASGSVDLGGSPLTDRPEELARRTRTAHEEREHPPEQPTRDALGPVDNKGIPLGLDL